MFSENGKESLRQSECLAMLDCFGKGALLLPFMAGNMGGREFLVSLLLVGIPAVLFSGLMRRLKVCRVGSPRDLLEERIGGASTRLILLLGVIGEMVELIFLTEVFAEFAGSFVLEESSRRLLRMMILAAGFLGSGVKTEVQGRLASIWYPFLFYPMLFLLAVSVLTVQPGYFVEGSPENQGIPLRSLIGMYGVFGSMGIRLFCGADQAANPGKTGQSGVLKVLLSLLLLFAVQVGSFGERGISGFTWPAAALMSSAAIPGGFLERWDVIFAGLLLSMLFVSAAMDFGALVILERNLFPEKKERNCRLVSAGGLLMLAWMVPEIGLWKRVYFVVNGCSAVPIYGLLACFLLYLENRRKGKVS